MGQSGLIFVTVGIAFIAVGLSGQRTFLWIGIPFVIAGLTGLMLSRKETTPADDDKGDQPGSDDNDS